MHDKKRKALALSRTIMGGDDDGLDSILLPILAVCIVRICFLMYCTLYKIYNLANKFDVSTRACNCATAATRSLRFEGGDDTALHLQKRRTNGYDTSHATLAGAEDTGNMQLVLFAAPVATKVTTAGASANA